MLRTATRFLTPALCLAALAASSDRTRAGGFQVSPVRIELDDDTRSRLISVTSAAGEELRLQVSAHRWTQGEAGETLLAPSAEVTVYPSLLVLKPGETRKLRITVSAGASAREATFRLLFDELEPLVKPAGMVMLTRVSVPLYFRPSAPDGQVRGAIVGPTMAGGQLAFSLENRSNVHWLGGVTMTGFAADGSQAWREELAAFPLLAGGRRRVVSRAIGAPCSGIRRVLVEATGPLGTFLAELAPPPSGACP